MNPCNVLCGPNMEIVICDFGKTRIIKSFDKNLREWYQFWASIRYFASFYGIDVPKDRTDYWLTLGEKHYTYQFRFSENDRNRVENEWIQKEKRLVGLYNGKIE